MKKKYGIVGIIIAFTLCMLGTVAFATNDPSYGLNDTAKAAKLNTESSVPTIAGNVIGTLLSMISVLFFVLVLYGGILWMTARGSSETTEKALNTIIAATIGIIIIMGAYALTNFVFKLGGNVGSSGSQEQGDSGGNNSPVSSEIWCLAVDRCSQQGDSCPSGTDYRSQGDCLAALEEESPAPDGGNQDQSYCYNDDVGTCNPGSGGGCEKIFTGGNAQAECEAFSGKRCGIKVYQGQTECDSIFLDFDSNKSDCALPYCKLITDCPAGSDCTDHRDGVWMCEDNGGCNSLSNIQCESTPVYAEYCELQ